jgi:hypothetical protein
MRAACIASAAASLAACCIGCASDDKSVPACDGGDAAGFAEAGDAPANADAVTAGDALDAQGASEGGPASADAGQVADVSTADGTLSTNALVRVANWSPDAPAVDFCIAPHGTRAFVGPVVGAIGASVDAGTAGLTFPSAGTPVQAVSSYFSVAPGLYDLRVVVAMGGSCTVPIIPDVTNLPPLTARHFATIALVGDVQPTGGDPGLQLASFSDDGVSSQLVFLRFINASPSMAAADMGTGAIGVMGGFTPLFGGVPFGTAGTAPQTRGSLPEASWPTVDDNGYRELFSLSDATLSAHDPRLGTDAVVTSGVSIAPGSAITIVLVGGTSAGAPPQLLECVDNARTVGPLSSCMLLP